jgi:hypothetical protein
MSVVLMLIILATVIFFTIIFFVIGRLLRYRRRVDLPAVGAMA